MIRYVVDKNRPYAQVLEEEHLHGSLSAVTGYVYGDGLISSTIDGTLTQYYHADGMGSVRGLSDASGAMTDRYAYDAYGMLTNSSGASANPYLYRGEQYDTDLDAYYLRARYYQPGTGRLLTTDPVEGFPTSPMSLHRYLYGNDNPVSFVDPSGQMSLNESIITTGIIGNLAGITWAATTESGRNTYSWMAENVFPDAFVVGLAGIFSVDMTPLLKFAKQAISRYFNVPLPPALPNVNGFYTEGFEVLLSVSSAQLAVFHTYGGGVEMQAGTPPLGDVGGMIYKGYVWNLWNDKDYEGWFAGFALGSFSMFWDRDDLFQGPWGVARPMASKFLLK